MPKKNTAEFARILNHYLNLRQRDAPWLAGRLPSDSTKSRKSTVDAGTVRRWCNGETTPGQSETIDAIVRELGIDAAQDRHDLYAAAGFVAAPLPPPANVQPAPPLTLSPRHRQYLAQVCGAMKRVNLANILETQRREPELLDIYVPLPVDAEVVLEVRNRQVRDWWLNTGGERNEADELAEARLDVLDEAGREAFTRQRPKAWPALHLAADDLAPLVEYVRGKLAAGELTANVTARGLRREENARWRIDAEQAASLQPRMVLIGDPGSGKSSFLRHLALCLAGECLRRAGDAATPGRARRSWPAGWRHLS
jgi:hypothetical protein